MTITSAQNQIQVAGNGVQTAFQYNFVADAVSDITVSAVASNGSLTTISSTNYSVSINAPAVNQLWGVGGTVFYPLVGSPLPVGNSLLIQRILPLTQQITTQNQGNYYSAVTEQALDTLEMQIQQVSSRTTQWRGTWITNTLYNVGDIVQDGANGSNTLNYYQCSVSNTSGTWATDLGNGDWSVSALAAVPTGMLTLTGDVTGSGATPISTTLKTVNVSPGSFTNANLTVNAKGLVTSATNGSAGSGTVTSVAYYGDGVLQSSTASVAVTSAGSIGATLLSQVANTFLSGPTSGSNATPTFRTIGASDLPFSGITKGNTLTLNPYSVGTVVSGAHGLSGIPNGCIFALTCLTGEGGYTANDVVIINGSNLGISVTDTVLTFAANATGAFMITNSSQAPEISRRDTAANFTITANNWKLTAIPTLV